MWTDVNMKILIIKNIYRNKYIVYDSYSERKISDINEYNEVKESYCLQIDDLQDVNENFIIMHPLPRVNEISVGQINILQLNILNKWVCI